MNGWFWVFPTLFIIVITLLIIFGPRIDGKD